MDDATFRRNFFRALNDMALEPDDTRYVPIYDDTRIAADDPVAMMQTTVEWTIETSVQLFSGFRGTGKSTELRRLRKRLRDAGYIVLLFDAEDYLNLSIPVDVPDFLLAVAGAVGEKVVEEGLLPDDPAKLSYWERFEGFLKRIRVPEVSAEVNTGLVKVGAKANLRSDPEFTRMLQQRMTGHLGAFVDDVRGYMHDVSMALRSAHPDAEGVVLIVDSIEHIRGISNNAEEVQRSVESLFAVHASKLHFKGFHLIYTVPPWLKVLFPGLSSLYEPGGVQVLPTLKVCGRDGRQPFEPGLEIMERVVAHRGDWQRLLSPEQLRHVTLQSGGHLRDLLRILADLLRRTTKLPVTDELVQRTLAAARNEFLPIAEDDARWLAQIAGDNSVALPDVDRLPTLARFLDTHLVLCYRNGEEWYNVHPLIREEVLREASPSRP
ncbi:hypothetical protein NE235_36475 [Actinoallomurus spadix]|uniref:Uncharacterized protein n=1 Tax=Actinoallomurus spadix TaxID=79912 RepID=A0ABP3H096_9ACTN|nr:hypothetical protein [Actinoallomurus spadix]MCO5991625.1 hypothetical protein [Actinoallomurus spadix]